VEDYAFKAQLLNYELMRPMFEAFSANRYDATGVIQWMLNSAWPEMYWQLYDSYLLPNAAYYATKKAGNPIHAIYNYGDQSVYLVNDQLNSVTNLKLLVKIFDIHSNKYFEKTIIIDIAPNTSKNITKLPVISNISETYFISLKIFSNGNEIDDNFYWLSKKQDVLDYDAAEKMPWAFHTPSKQYADYSELKKLDKVNLTYSIHKITKNESVTFEIKMNNPSDKIAFFTELRITDKTSGESILPVIWSDNYISLLPGENKIYTATIKKKHIGNKEINFVFKGWNTDIKK
ncbi:MAG: hypothetical protein J7K34_10305, partial [Flavobacteriaceae bacterium]|nr:hypothetical protein [Flavobacteriaceae bacterium]